jgi:hypothetical protein
MLLALGATMAWTSSSHAAAPCWQRVTADWSADGRVDRVYPLACYREAVSHLPEDLRSYSSAPDDIHRALLERRSIQSLSAVGERPVEPLAATDPGTGRSRAVMIIPGVIGFVAVAGLGTWLARSWARRPR